MAEDEKEKLKKFDFLKAVHFDSEFKKLINDYDKKIKFGEEKMANKEKMGIKKFEPDLEDEFSETEIPVVDNPPVVRTDLLNELQNLMFENHFIEKKVDIEKYIDRRFVD